MKRGTRLSALALLPALLLGAASLHAADFKDVLRSATIAVELRSHRPEPYDFAGEVGSLRVNLERGWIELVTLSGGSRPTLQSEQFQITDLQEFPDSIDFSCVDRLGFAWRGKVYYSKQLDRIFDVEIIRRASPRKIINLTQRGESFLERHGLKQLDLGI